MDFIEQVALKINRLGLNAPAILLLEAHKPLSFMGSQLLLVAQPTLNLFLSSRLVDNAVTLLADPDQLEALIAQLEPNNHLSAGKEKQA